MKSKEGVISRNSTNTHDTGDLFNLIKVRSFRQNSHRSRLELNKRTLRSSIGGECNVSSSCLELTNKRIVQSVKKLNYSISLIGRKEFEMKKLLLPKEMTSGMTESEFQSFKNDYLLKNLHNDELIEKLRQRSFSVLQQNKAEELKRVYKQIKEARHTESNLLFSKFPSAGTPCDVFYWRNIVSSNYDLTASLLKLIDLLSKEEEEDKKSSQPKLHFSPINNLKKPTTLKLNASQLKAIRKANESLERQIEHRHPEREGRYLINIYNLEEEIKELTHLLDKSKHYSQQYLQIKEEMASQTKDSEDLRMNCKFKVNEITMKMTIMNQKVEAFKGVLQQLTEEKEELKRKVIELKQEIGGYKSTIRKLKETAEEKRENIGMLHEEKETMYYLYSNEREAHNVVLLSMQALEQRIKRESQMKYI